MEKFVVIQFPESQTLSEIEGFEEHCHLINDDSGLEQYGSCAYFVEEQWAKDHNVI